jgi:hypothetical protein
MPQVIYRPLCSNTLKCRAVGRCRAALKTENVGNGVGLLHLNRIRAQAPSLKSDTGIVRGTCGAMIAWLSRSYAGVLKGDKLLKTSHQNFQFVVQRDTGVHKMVKGGAPDSGTGCSKAPLVRFQASPIRSEARNN